MEVLEKQKVIDLIQNFPDKFSIDELLERVILLAKIERSQEQFKKGETYTNDEMKSLVTSWQK